MNNRGQFSIIAALFVAVILISTVVLTYSSIRNAQVKDQPQILSAIDETNFAIKQILGFTVGYYGSVLQVTGNSSYARMLALQYLQSGLVNIANMHPQWGTSFNLTDPDLSTNWFANRSYSIGDLAVNYNLTGLGIYKIRYETSCKLGVRVMSPLTDNQARLNITKDEKEPLINLGRQNFRFYNYSYADSSWELVNPVSEPTSFANGTYVIDIPPGVDPYSYVIQVEDQRGIIVVASSFSRYTCELAWNPYLPTRYAVAGSTPEILGAPDGNYKNIRKGNTCEVAGYHSGAGIIKQVCFNIVYYGSAPGALEWYRRLDGGAWIKIEDLPQGGTATSPLTRTYNATNLRALWTWANLNATHIQFKNNFNNDNNDGAFVDAIYVTVVYDIAGDYSTIPNETIVVELLQNGTMRWLGQSLQLTTQTKPIPPIPVKAIRVNQTINGVNQEVPFQIEDWTLEYMIPLGLTNNASVFSSRTMLVFLANSKVSKVTIWWDGSDRANQTSYAYTNRYFNDNPSTGTLRNGRLTIQFAASGFTVTSTAGSTSSTARLMRINNEYDTTDPELAYVIYNGVVRDIVQGEPEYSGGADNCPNLYAHIVLTLPANATYYTYQLRTMFVQSQRDRTITDFCPIQISALETGVFGSTATSSSYTTVSADYMYGSLFTSPSATAIVQSTSFYGRSGSGTANVKCLIVRHSDMQIIAVTNPVSVTTSAQWWTATFSSPPTLSPNTECVLMIIPANSVRFYYTTGSTNQEHRDTSNSYSSPTNPTDASHSNYQYSIYCSHTVLQTENGTSNGSPIVSSSTGLFYDSSSSSWQHHWSQFIAGTRGAGIMFTSAANRMLYAFDTIAGSKTGAIRVSTSSGRVIELLPVSSMAQVQFTYALDLTWYGAVVTFDGTTPIFKEESGNKTGLWITVEYPPVVSVSTES